MAAHQTILGVQVGKRGFPVHLLTCISKGPVSTRRDPCAGLLILAYIGVPRPGFHLHPGVLPCCQPSLNHKGYAYIWTFTCVLRSHWFYLPTLRTSTELAWDQTTVCRRYLNLSFLVVFPPAFEMSLPFFGLDIGYSAAIACAIPLVVVAVHLVPYLVDRHGMRSIPGPWLAKFTDVWLGRVAARGHRSDVIRELHRKYGPSVSRLRSIRAFSTFLLVL